MSTQDEGGAKSGNPSWRDSHGEQTLNSSTVNWLMNNYHLCTDLPEPGQTYLRAEQYFPSKSAFYGARNKGVIKWVEKTSYSEDGPSENLCKWRTDPVAYDFIQKRLEESPGSDDPSECEHPGFVNHGDGKYECKYCDHDGFLSREEILNG